MTFAQIEAVVFIACSVIVLGGIGVCLIWMSVMGRETGRIISRDPSIRTENGR